MSGIAKIRLREVEAFLNALEKGIKKVERMNKTVPKKLKRDMEQAAWSIITDWYASYDRKSYDPMGSLLYAYKITVDDKTWGYDIGAEFMEHFKDSHHQKKIEIIYHNAFELGYHGGSTQGKVPWWRTPAPFYPEWLGPAVKTWSPKERLTKELDKILEETVEKTKSEITEIINTIKYTSYYRRISS